MRDYYIFCLWTGTDSVVVTLVYQIRFPTAKPKEPFYEEKKMWIRFNLKKTHTFIKKMDNINTRLYKFTIADTVNDLVNKKRTLNVSHQNVKIKLAYFINRGKMESRYQI